MILGWQSVPLHIDPIALAVGSFALRWYALCALAGGIGAYALFRRLTQVTLSRRESADLFFWLFLGSIIGARVGFAFLYAPDYFLADPIRLISPYGENGEWVGIRGLSFHGGILGAALALAIFSLYRGIRRERFWQTVDALAFVAPLISFFGRIGNFLNGELIGRPTGAAWGMRAASDGVLRHPSQLYEAVLEGALLFTILLLLSRRLKTPGSLAASYLFGYGLLRFIGEYFREPDPWIGTLAGGLSLGQILSLGCMGAGAILGAWIFGKKRAIIRGD